MRISLSQLLSRWFPPAAAQHPRLEHCLQRSIEQINPLLTQSRGYPGEYGAALHGALGYLDQLIEQLPPAIALNSSQFGSNPLVRALFASPAELEQTLRLSIAMRDYRPSVPGRQTLYALMGVRWERKLQFGMAQHNGIIQSDVPQQAINFKDHTFTLPAASEAEARELIYRHFVERLSSQVKGRLVALKQQRESHYLEIKRLESSLRHNPQQPEAASQLEQLKHEWSELNEQLENNRHIEPYREVMGAPEQALRLTPYELSIDKMGIERSAGEGGTPLQLLNLHAADRRVWTVMLVSFPWVPPRSQQEQLAEAHRWLAIS